MLTVGASLSETEPVVAPEGLANGYGLPCVFSGCRGFFHPADGAIGVVLCSPWGYEDLVMRKSWRLLAEAIAKVGYPCLRFDYPGTGDSLGHATEPASTSDWIVAINAAADLVRRASGVKHFVFIGQSLGAALALEAARWRGDVVGLYLISPVVKGRAYVRELSMTSKLVADRLGVQVVPDGKEAISVVGFALAPAMVESLKVLDATRIEAIGCSRAVVYDRADRVASAEIVEHLRRLGVAADLQPVAPYELMVSDATTIQPLPVPIDQLVADLAARHPVRPVPSEAGPPLPSIMIGDVFREETIRFGAEASLFGILCRPAQPDPSKPAVILLNRGLNAHVGWRRVSVDHARGLAAAGITSLRIDVAGLGESRDAPGRPQTLIYSDLLLPDIVAAIDVLAARGHARIALAGVCSGAYMALRAAAADPRVTEVISVNPQRFLWHPNESVEDVVRFGLRSMNDYIGDVKSRGALRKLIRSRKRIVPAVRFLAKRYVRNAMARVPLKLRARLLRGSMAAQVERIFASFAARGTRISLVYSEADPGLIELHSYFGQMGCEMRHQNVTISLIADADHNLTTTRTSALMLDHMIAVAGEPIARDGPRHAARPSRVLHHAVCPT